MGLFQSGMAWHGGGKANPGQSAQNSAQFKVNVSVPWSHPRKIRVKPHRYSFWFC